MEFHISCVARQRLADTDTPVSLYLKLRDQFAETLLLEDSHESHSERGISYICCDPIASLSVFDGRLKRTYLDGSASVIDIEAETNVVEIANEYINSFSTDVADPRYSVNGLFGYFCYDAVQYFERIAISDKRQSGTEIPLIRLSVYRYVIVFDHARNTLLIVHNYYEDAQSGCVDFIDRIISTKQTPQYPFHSETAEASNCTDAEFMDIAKEGIRHCHRGDVFQIVLSRSFSQGFSGDEFNVYRALRSINPSQYLFYFDYGSYRLFGSSPEAQLRIRNGEATVHPIAGTYKRSGDVQEDYMLAELLRNDPKENAEHVMVVDLARNDLSKNYREVQVPVYKKIQFYSHVMHIVSEVTATTPVADLNPFRVLGDTFPAGTLSGAPKHRAMQLIDKLEKNNRGFYGGSIGFVGFDGAMNQAILIRSFLSRNNQLYYQAGAGIVAASKPENELAEVNNKIAALRKAIEIANAF